MDALTTFADRREFEHAVSLLEAQDIAFSVVSPDPAYGRVACPALGISEE